MIPNEYYYKTIYYLVLLLLLLLLCRCDNFPTTNTLSLQLCPHQYYYSSSS